jgi:valyl-tRNA synthetase
MSKTRGNVINPLVMVEEYGADALRFALVTGTTAGNDMRFTTERIQAARNFANKLWNASRFVLSNRPEAATRIASETAAPQLSLVDRWIISRRNHTVAEVTRLLEQFHLGEAGRTLHEFVWSQFCDWYIEASKVSLYGDDPAARAVTQSVLENTLAVILRLLHPFMPFVTEEIWRYLHPDAAAAGVESLIVAPWPEAAERDGEAEGFFDELIEAIRGVRNIRAEYDVEPGRYVPATIVAGSQSDAIAAHAAIIEMLGRVRPLTVHAALDEKPEQAVSVLTSRLAVYVPLAGLRDVEQERQRLQKEQADILANLERTQGLLANENFVNRAPPPVVAKEREKLGDLELRAQQIRERLAGLA